MVSCFGKQIYRKYQNLGIHITKEKEKLIKNIRDIKETLMYIILDNVVLEWEEKMNMVKKIFEDSCWGFSKTNERQQPT